MVAEWLLLGAPNPRPPTNTSVWVIWDWAAHKEQLPSVKWIILNYILSESEQFYCEKLADSLCYILLHLFLLD